MHVDLAKYLSGVADLVGINIWSIDPRYIPKGSLEETYAFAFDGIGSLPHLIERANPQLIENIQTVIDEKHNKVHIY